MERDRLVMLVYKTEASGGTCRRLFFLETDEENCKAFALCIRSETSWAQRRTEDLATLLRRYEA